MEDDIDGSCQLVLRGHLSKIVDSRVVTNKPQTTHDALSFSLSFTLVFSLSLTLIFSFALSHSLAFFMSHSLDLSISCSLALLLSCSLALRVFTAKTT